MKKINKETKKLISELPNLKKYAEHFEKTGGQSELAGYLPFLVIWFRDTFKFAGIDDGEVPQLFGYDEDSEEAEDFWTWGHNSRYANTFTIWLLRDINNALSVAVDLACQNEIDPDVEKRIGVK